MRTNGGCRCFEKAGFGPSAVSAALQMLPEITHLRAEVEKLRRVRDAAEKVRGLGMLCMMSKHCEECNTLRAALDAAKEG